MMFGLILVCCCVWMDEEYKVHSVLRRWRINLVVLFIYTFLLEIMIWATVEANTNPEDYEVLIIKKGYFNSIAGIILSIGFLPVILIILVLAIVIVCGISFICGYIVVSVLYFLLKCVLWLLIICCICPCADRLLDKLPKMMKIDLMVWFIFVVAIALIGFISLPILGALSYEYNIL